MDGKTIVERLCYWEEPGCPHAIVPMAKFFCKQCVADAIDAAIVAEREACAQTAIDVSCLPGEDVRVRMDQNMRIASAIRRRTP